MTSHLTKKYRTVRHKHPKRTSIVTTVDYGDVKEISEITTAEKPLESVYQTNNEKNPNKIHFGWLGKLEVYGYQDNSESFFIGIGKMGYAISVGSIREFYQINNRIRWNYGLKIGRNPKMTQKIRNSGALSEK